MNDFELRLAALERTNRRYRLGLTTSLSVLALVALAGFGQVGPGNGQQQYPRIIVADSITCQNLNAYTGTINQLGTNNATVQYMTLGDGKAEGLTIKNANLSSLRAQRAAMGQTSVTELDVVGPNSGAGFLLAPTAEGGLLQMFDNQNKPLVSLSSRDGGGLVSLFGKGGYAGVEVGANDKSGSVKTMNSFNKVIASLGRAETGDGEIVAGTRNGNRAVVIRSDELGKFGRVLVQEEGGFPLVRIEGDENGGVVKTLKQKVETARMPSK